MEEARRRKLSRAASAGAALLAALGLVGCEQPYEKALRLSCHWNLDLNLKGCSRLGFKHCVDNCEYCVGAMGTPFEGKSDECSQLKCAAYCAKRDGEECLATYRQLCSEGHAVIEQQGGTCDANCNAAAPRSPRLLGLPTWLAVGFLVLARLPGALSRGNVFAALLALVALSLQGCGECPPGTPSLSWPVDLEAMDRRAGCINEWSFVWGNPCASDVPVVMAKKGFREQTDGDFRRGSVENEAYSCRQRGVGGYCQEWTAAESSCDEEDFGLCMCKQAGPGGRYCSRWQCISKEANQHLCWKSCCGKNCDPCVECGLHGSSPFPMNEQVFHSLLQSDGTSQFVLSSGTNSTEQAVTALRRAHWGAFSYLGQCIMPRDIHSVHETACQTWREIETEIANCECTQEAPGGKYCQNWRCEEKDVGLFSILFAHARSYASLLTGMEEEVYTCTQSQKNGDEERCIKWKGDISGYEEVETTQCGPSCPNGGTWCDSWVCNEYELPRVHDEDQWGKRLGFTIVHCFWLLPPAVIGSGMFHDRNYAAGHFEACAFFVVVIILWCIGLVRYDSADGRWIRPALPLALLLLTLWLPYALAIYLSLWLKGGGGGSGGSDGIGMLPAAAAVAVFLTCASIWTTGLVGFLILGLPGLCALCCLLWKSRAENQSLARTVNYMG